MKRPHNYRPAHIHFLIYKPGFKTMISQIYVNDDPLLETDVQFGVTKALIGNYVRHENEPAPAADVKGPWYSFDYTFAMESGRGKAAARADHRQGGEGNAVAGDGEIAGRGKAALKRTRSFDGTCRRPAVRPVR